MSVLRWLFWVVLVGADAFVQVVFHWLLEAGAVLIAGYMLIEEQFHLLVNRLEDWAERGWYRID